MAWDELVRLRIRGLSIKECAGQLGFSRNTVEKWVLKDAFKVKLARTREQIFNQVSPTVETLAAQAVNAIEARIEEIMERYSVEAVHKIRQVMHDAESEQTQLKAAIDLADRGMRTSKTKKVQGSVGVSFLTPELLLKAAKAAREALEHEALGRVITAVPLDERMNPDIPLNEENDDDPTEEKTDG